MADTAMLDDEEFKHLASAKKRLAHIVNESCKDSIVGRWLVIEETVSRIRIEVRYLERLERDNLCNKVFSYVDITPGTYQKVGRRGIKNEIVTIEVQWTLKEMI